MTLGVIALAAVVMVLDHRARDSADRRAARAFGTDSVRVASFVESFLAEQMAWQSAVAAESFTGEPTAADLASVGRPRNVLFSMVVGADGTVLAIDPERPDRAVGDEIASRFPHIEAALNGSPAVSPAFTSAPTDTGVVLAIAVPFRGSDGDRVYSAGIELGRTLLPELFEAGAEHWGAFADTLLIDEAGQILSSDRRRATTSAAPQVLRAGATDEQLLALLGVTPSVHEVDDHLLAAAPVAGTRWTLLMTAPTEAVVAIVGTPDRTWVAAMTVVGMLLLAVGWWGERMWRERAQSRRRATELGSRHRELNLLFVHGITPAFMSDPEGRLLAVNNALALLTGWDEVALVGMNLADLLGEPADQALQASATTPGGGGFADTELVTRRGDRRICALSVRSVPGRSDDRQLVVGQLQDRTNERATEEQLRRQRDALARFTSTVAHDLKTPLTSVGGFASLLLEGDLPASQREELLQRLSANAMRAAEHLESMLEGAEAADVTAVETVELRDLVVWLRELLGPTLAETGGTIDATTSELGLLLPVPMVRAVLINLVTNSLQYHREGLPPRVVVSVDRYEDEWQFGVADNGRGLPASERERVFGSDGVGHEDNQVSGLSAARDLVRGAGGRMWVEANPAGGSIVKFTLPAPSAPSEARDPKLSEKS